MTSSTQHTFSHVGRLHEVQVCFPREHDLKHVTYGCGHDNELSVPQLASCPQVSAPVPSQFSEFTVTVVLWSLCTQTVPCMCCDGEPGSGVSPEPHFFPSMFPLLRLQASIDQPDPPPTSPREQLPGSAPRAEAIQTEEILMNIRYNF